MDAAILQTESARSAPTTARKSSSPPAAKTPAQKASVFHQDWWLKAASADRFSEVKIEEGNAVVARLPFVTAQKFGFKILKMPPFTHVLGPAVDAGDGKYQALLKNRIKLTKQLIESLPKFDYFFQICDSSSENGLALADGIAFQECGFRAGTQYTFHIDSRKKLENLFNEMNVKTKQRVRAAEKCYTVITVYEPETFIRFYLDCLKSKKLKPNVLLDRFSNLYLECRSRDCGQILAAIDEQGAPVAMTFVVWDQRKMYYLMSARSSDIPDRGAVSLLIWKAITKAHELGLVFDLDGVSSAGTAHFLSGFGGELISRLTVAYTRPLYSTLQHFGRISGLGNTSSYT